MKTTTFLYLFFCWIPFMSIQGQEITGQVTDERGHAIKGVSVTVCETQRMTVTDNGGNYRLKILAGDEYLCFSISGYAARKVAIKGRTTINIVLTPEQIIIVEEECDLEDSRFSPPPPLTPPAVYDCSQYGYNKSIDRIRVESHESYAKLSENVFKQATEHPLSTFSIDVDVASYSNVRRYINHGSLPPVDAVRIEEMINYFNYQYEQPVGDNIPIAIHSELSSCPWNKDNYLLHLGLQAKFIPTEQLPPSNLVFLLDVSGSMNSPNKLPLLKSSFALLVEHLRAEDMVSIVVYAGSSGLVLPPTPGNQKQKIMAAMNRLQAGGSTAGGAGLKLAYNTATKHFMENGNNRIIMATDGDFNVGLSSNSEMEKLIEEKRKQGIAISVLGFGMGNYKDDKMEIIADKGNGNYAYIDNIQEAKKVLVNEFGGTLFTLAKDVKLQLEFNPAVVKSYRLIGYENRLLNKEDFDDDQKDAGELGAGHSVTALYEIVPTQGKWMPENLRYQNASLSKYALNRQEVLALKVRYKEPDGFTSKLIEQKIQNSPIPLQNSSDNFRFSAAIAQFGMLLRKSSFAEGTSWEKTAELARGAKGEDPEGYRSEMIRLIDIAKDLSKNSPKFE